MQTLTFFAVWAFLGTTQIELVHVNAYTTTPLCTNEVSACVAGPFHPLAWWYTYVGGSIFGQDIQGIHTRITPTLTEGTGILPPWKMWADEIETALTKLSGDFVVFCGNAPPVVWMYIGHLFVTMPATRIAPFVVPLKNSKPVPELLNPIDRSSYMHRDTHDNILRIVSCPGKADVAVLHVTTSAQDRLTDTQNVQISKLFPGHRVKFWMVEPTEETVNVDATNVRYCMATMERALGYILKYGYIKTLVLAASTPESVAFKLGTVANIQMFQNIVFLSRVNGIYYKAFGDLQ